jgi:hypothetical protein
MPIILEQRFNLLLSMAKDPRHPTVARENLAAAKELIDTLFAVGHIDSIESRAYRSLCTTAGIIVSTAELKRSASLPVSRKANEDGVFAAVAEDGAYRFNPASGTFE